MPFSLPLKPAALHRILIRTWCAREADQPARLHAPNTRTFLIHFPAYPADYYDAVALPSDLTCPTVDQLDILPEP